MRISSGLALVVGDQPEVVERLVAILHEHRCEVRRMSRAAAAARVILATPFDLVVVVLPLAGARDVLASVRAGGSASRYAGAMALETAAADQPVDVTLARLANAVLPADEVVQLRAAVGRLLHVAPRVPIEGAARLRLHAQDRGQVVAVGNVSASGLLLHSAVPLPVGSDCALELQLAKQSGPIRGRARVVRQDDDEVGVSFLSFGGEGASLLNQAIAREMAMMEDAPRPSRHFQQPFAAPAASVAADHDSTSAAPAENPAVGPQLEQALRAGLAKRLAADWYLAGADLGLDSLRGFALVVDAVYRGRSRNAESTRLQADLFSVHSRLGELTRPNQGAAKREEILLEVRPAIERLLRQLGDERPQEAKATSEAAQQRSALGRLCLDVNRQLGWRRALQELSQQLDELGRPQYLVARRQLHRRAEQLCSRHRAWGPTLGMQHPEQLETRAGRRAAAQAAELELERLDESLTLVHERVYADKVRQLASGNRDEDLSTQRLRPLLAERLRAGYEYLVRVHGAYRNALELAGADPALLSRAADLEAAAAPAATPPQRRELMVPAPLFASFL